MNGAMNPEVKLWTRRLRAVNCSTKQAILEYLLDGPASSPRIGPEIDVKPAIVKNYLDTLERSDLVERRGKDPDNRSAILFAITDEGRHFLRFAQDSVEVSRA